VDWPTAFVSVAASAATASVAIWAVVSQRSNADADRRHDVEVRRQERRALAYVELLAALHRLRTGIDRTSPIFVSGEPPEPPSPMTDEESWRLSALGDVVASDAVRDLIAAWTRKQANFYTAVWLLRRIQEQEGVRPSEIKEDIRRHTIPAVAGGGGRPNTAPGRP
jgi:hypothetical protein